MEFREKINQIKAAVLIFQASFHLLAADSLSASWAAVISPWSTVAQIPSQWLAALLGHKGRIACGCPGVRVGPVIIPVPGTTVFYMY